MLFLSPIYKQPKFDIIFVAKPAKFNLKVRKNPLGWLNNSITTRQNIKEWDNTTKSIIVTGLYYSRKPEKLAHNKYYLRISEYAAIRDYHKVFRDKLNNLAKLIKLKLEEHNNTISLFSTNIQNELLEKFKYKVFVDSSPVYEKGYMLQAPNTFLGKNGLVLGPMGSRFLIGGISTNIPYKLLTQIIKDLGSKILYNLNNNPANNQNNKYLCTNCNLCIKNCPTGAIAKTGFQINIPLCISYLTVEAKGVIPHFLQKRMKNWLFGCDECQNICPYNKIYQTNLSNFELSLRFGKVLPTVLYFRKAARMSFQGFYKYFAGTPVIRMGYKKFKHRVSWYVKNKI